MKLTITMEEKYAKDFGTFLTDRNVEHTAYKDRYEMKITRFMFICNIISVKFESGLEIHIGQDQVVTYKVETI